MLFQFYIEPWFYIFFLSFVGHCRILFSPSFSWQWMSGSVQMFRR